MNDAIPSPGKVCSAAGCINSDTTHTCFAFPVVEKIDSHGKIINKMHLERCKLWVQRSGNSSLLTVNPVDIHKTAFLCQEHFDNNCLLSSDSQTLRRDALPTIFSCSPLTDEVVFEYGNNLLIPDNANLPDAHQDTSTEETDPRGSMDLSGSNSNVNEQSEDDSRGNQGTPSETHQREPVIQESNELVNSSESKECQPCDAVSKTKSQDFYESSKHFKTSYCRRVQARERIKRLRQDPSFVARSNALRRKKYHQIQLERRRKEQSRSGSEPENSEQDIPRSVNKTGRKKPSRRCAAVNCRNHDLTHSCFAFPRVVKRVSNQELVDERELRRCRIWLQRAGRVSLLKIDPKTIHRNTFLCEDHFDHSEVTHGLVRRITKTLPTNFDCNPLANELVAKYGSTLSTGDNPHIVPDSDALAEEVCSEDADENQPDPRATTTLSFVNEEKSTDEPALRPGNSGSDIRSKASENKSGAPEESDTESAIEYSDIDSDDDQRLYVDEDCKDSTDSRNSITASRNDDNANHELHDENDSIESSDVEPLEEGQIKTEIRACSAVDCPNNNVSHFCFAFPKLEKQVPDSDQLERCKIWIQRSGNRSLLAVDPSDLHNEAFLCHAHFGSDDIQSGGNTTLKENALPTIFNCSSLPDESLVPYGKNLWSSSDDGIASTDRQNDNDTVYPCQNTSLVTDTKREEPTAVNGLKFCAAASCSNNNISHPCFAFPKIEKQAVDNEQVKRCKIWIQRSGNISLLSLDPADLHEKAFLCEEHFDGKDGSLGDSVPSIFACTALADELMIDYGRNLSCSTSEGTFLHDSHATQPVFNYSASDRLAAEYGSTLWNHLSDNSNLSNDVASPLSSLATNRVGPTTNPEPTLGSNYAALDNQNYVRRGLSLPGDPNYQQADSITPFYIDYNIVGQSRNDPSLFPALYSGLYSSGLIPKVSTKNCSAANCSNSETTCTLFRFPKVKHLVNKEVVINSVQLERCKIWAQRAGNIALLSIDAVNLHHRARLCEFHFDSQALGKNNKFLRKNVLPTIFQCPPLADALFAGYGTNVCATPDNTNPCTDDAVHHPSNDFNQEDSSACRMDEDSGTGDALNDSKEDIKLEFNIEEGCAKVPSDQVASKEGTPLVILNEENSAAPLTENPIRVKEEFPPSCYDSADHPISIQGSPKERIPLPWQSNIEGGSRNHSEAILGIPSDVSAREMQKDKEERRRIRREQARERMRYKRQDPQFLLKEKEAQRRRYQRVSAKRRKEQFLLAIAKQLPFSVQPDAYDQNYAQQQDALRQLHPGGPVREQVPIRVQPGAYDQNHAQQQDAQRQLNPGGPVTEQEGRPEPGTSFVFSGLDKMRANQLSKEAQRRERNTQRHRLARLDPVFRQREREREQERRRRARQEQNEDRDPLSAEELSKEVKRRAARKLYTEMQRKLRQDPAYREVEREQDRERKRKLREDPNWKQAERQRNAERQRRAREDPAYRELEREKDRERKRMARQDPAVREAELKRNAERQRRARGDPSFREAELKRNAERQRKNRQDPTVRQAEREKNAERQRKAREDPAFREAERQQNAERQRKLRQDPAFREAERVRLQRRRLKERALREGYLQPDSERCLQFSGYSELVGGAEQPHDTERCLQFSGYSELVGGAEQPHDTERCLQVSEYSEPAREAEQQHNTERCLQVAEYSELEGELEQRQDTECGLPVTRNIQIKSEYLEQEGEALQQQQDTGRCLQASEYSEQGEVKQRQDIERGLQVTRNIQIKNEYLEQ